VSVKFPKKLRFLFEPHRYKVAYGGRGSGKSWSFARALLIQGAKEPIRILCTREIQKSIADSVHKLLSDQVAELGLSSFYEVLQTTIRGKNGTEFVFTGLQSHTVDSIKSYEGVDRVWCEEAHAISAKSWQTLLPTIRKDGSEIWVTYNPQLESDETHQRFVVNPPPDTVAVLMNYSDNPWFPSVLEAERKHAKETLKPDLYAHIWEGRCMPAVEGAIYFDQVAQADKRIKEVPHDGLLKTHVVFDLGFNDAMSIILVQKASSELRIVNYVEGTQRTLPDYSADLKALRLDGQPINWGEVYLPHDGFAKRHQTGKADADVMRELGWSVQKVPEIGVEMGINRAREIFPRVYFNEERTKRLIECLKRYRRQINQTTGEPGQPLHDEFSHAADAFRYMAVVSDSLGNDSWGGSLSYPRLNVA